MSATPGALAVDLLARVVAYAATRGVALPDLRYVAAGDAVTIPFDGPAVMVSLDFTSPGRPGADLNNAVGLPALVMRYAQFAVTIVRPAVTMNDATMPPVAELAADGQTNIADTDVIHGALVQILADCQRPGGWVGPGTPLALGRVTTVGPQGAVFASVGTIQVALL